MEFRPANFIAEAKSQALPRLRADEHPFSSPSSPSPLQVSDSLIKGGVKTLKKSSTSKHLEELEDPEKFTEEEGTKVITRQEYVSRLHELKEEIIRAWQAGVRVTSLKFSIKVARLLMDTSVSQFYPTVFLLATDIMDMLGDMVWERIKQKAEFSEDGTKRNGCICDPTTIELLFEISQALHDGVDFLNVKDADNQPARLISRFVNMVDYGSEMEHHLTFLVECRGAFGSINGLRTFLFIRPIVWQSRL